MLYANDEFHIEWILLGTKLIIIWKVEVPLRQAIT